MAVDKQGAFALSASLNAQSNRQMRFTDARTPDEYNVFTAVHKAEMPELQYFFLIQAGLKIKFKSIECLDFREACAMDRTLRLFEFDFQDRKSTRVNSSHVSISYAVF